MGQKKLFRKRNYKSEGFTLLEVLLVIGITGILAGFVIIAVNPSKQLATARNVQRRSDVRVLHDAVYQFTIDNRGFPSGLTTTNQYICADGQSCSGVSLDDLTTDQEFLAALPVAPNWSDADTTGYQIRLADSGNSIVITAPNAELEETIVTPPIVVVEDEEVDPYNTNDTVYQDYTGSGSSLRLTAMGYYQACDDTYGNRWRVRNEVETATTFTWEIVGSDETGAFELDGDQAVFFTSNYLSSASGGGTMRILVSGEQVTVKAQGGSTKDVCDE